MIDVIVYLCINPRPMGSCLYIINPSGYALGFIIYHIKHERVYVQEADKGYRQGTGKLIIPINPCSSPAILLMIIRRMYYR